MADSLRILVVEDSEDDAVLLLRTLERGGLRTRHRRVQTEASMREALAHETWDLVVSDFSMPGFSALAALDVLRQTRPDVPFIIVSGTIGEEAAVEALKNGAHDFLIKGRLARLVPAVRRALADADTRRRRGEMEEALRASEERFRTLIESMDDMVFTLDTGQRYDGVFGGWPATGPLSPGNVEGRTAREAFGAAEAEVHEAATSRALEGHRTSYDWSIEYGGTRRSFRTSLSPRRGVDGGVIGLVGVHRDVTEDKRVQAKLVSSDRLASVGLLAASIGHEINNPLASLLANLDLAERDVSEPDTREALGDAREAAIRIREIVRDLRLFSRETEDQAQIDVHGVLASSVRMAATEIRHKARLVTDFGRVPTVYGSFARLGQVFLNLIVNAAQALDDRGVEANEIRVTTRTDDDGWAVVEVADTGSGIPADVLPNLFTPFYTTKPEGVGTGLGLSICRRTVEAMSGEIAVESVVGRGSTFRVRLPPGPAREPSSPRAAPGPPAGTTLRRGRVMVVDDERIVASAVQRCLRREHDVTITTSALEALSWIRAGERYDVVLCDLMMPEMTGMQLHAEIDRVAPDQARRMVFLTGGAFTNAAREFLERVDNARIDKPFDVAALRALVSERVR